MYTTKQDQQWDEIALEVYGDERHADVLMAANPQHLDTYQFSAGVVLNTPELSEEQADALPPWR